MIVISLLFLQFAFEFLKAHHLGMKHLHFHWFYLPSWLQYQCQLALACISELISWQLRYILKAPVHLISYQTRRLFWLHQLVLECSALSVELKTLCDQFYWQQEIVRVHPEQYFSHSIIKELCTPSSGPCLTYQVFLVFNAITQQFFTILPGLFLKVFVFHSINHLRI